MLINKRNLQEALEIVKPGLASKEIIQQATSFAFLKDRVVTYNDNISISHPVQGLNIKGAIQAEELYKILSKIKIPEKEELELNVELSIKDNQVIFEKGRMKTGLTLQEEVKLPLDTELKEKGKWIDIPKNFLRFLKFTAPSCSRDMSRQVLTSVHVSKDGYIEASDNYRITKCDLGKELEIASFLLPANSALEVVKLAPTKMAEGKGWIHFSTEEETIISCRIYNEAFPDTTSFVNVEGNKFTFPQSIAEVLDRASIFSKRDHMFDEKVNITIHEDRLKVETDSETGWFEEELNIKYSGEEISFSITPYLLKGILAETLTFVLSPNKLKFEGEGWVYVSALKSR